jgi:hypothetical protein
MRAFEKVTSFKDEPIFKRHLFKESLPERYSNFVSSDITGYPNLGDVSQRYATELKDM